MSEMKIVYMDGNNTKAVVGSILSEDNFFITLVANGSGINFRIGKQFIISMKEVA